MNSHCFKNEAQVQQYLQQVLDNKRHRFTNDGIKLITDDNQFQEQEIRSISEMLHVNITILLQNPNDIHNYFGYLQRFLQKYSQQNSFAAGTGTQSKILRLLALMQFTHPVMNKKIEEFLGKYSAFSSLTFANRYDLESLNILCLVPTFNHGFFKLQQKTFKYKQDSYEQALWMNIVNTLSHNQFYGQWRNKAQQVSQENVCKVRDFVNVIYRIREIANKFVYDQLLKQLNQSNIIKLQQTPESQSMIQSSRNFTNLDIFSSFHQFFTVDYLPNQFVREKDAQYIEIWIDRTVEVNSLMGNFICKQKLGEFQYVKGPLMYAIEKGIILVLNNFEQISHQLLVTMRTLSTRNEINYNQRTIYARSGFKIIGICSLQGRKKAKSLQNSASVIPHFNQKPRVIADQIPFQHIKNEANCQYILQTVSRIEHLGLKAQTKLWRRMMRLRKRLVNSYLNDKDEKQTIGQLWNGYITQSLKDQIQVQIQQLTNSIDCTRNIQFQRQYKTLKIGRCQLTLKNLPSHNIVPTQYSLRILQRLAICQDPEINQSPLLISQTGCGKTTLVQYLAEIASKKLYVYNMSSGTDVTDLVGGFKPIDCRVMLKQLFYTFTQKFMNEVPGAQKNKAYINSLISYYQSEKLQLLLKSLIQSIPKIKAQLKDSTQEQLKSWDQMLRKYTNILGNLDKIDSNLVFSFIEGNLVTALKNGDWILIDQINLATNDVLQKIVPLVQGKSILLYEKGDLTHITRKQGFKIIACMNPATDSGKKPLPQNLHEKFTAINLSQPTRNDIEMMVGTLCPQLDPPQIADIFFSIKKIKTISLRNLSRSLSYINKNREAYGWQRATYDGLVLGYGQKDLLVKFRNQVVPRQKEGFKIIHGFLVEQGPLRDQKVQVFHLTKTFSEHLKDFLRAIAGTDLPVLLQGPTSAGKTSMIKYVAQLAGHRCIRINNHEHTQIQEYLGNYFPDKQGKLVFREGPLVTAVRQGHWLILDELNLAKTQILECLNRLLDDNRELFIPEQQKHIKPHKDFRIFATQNPSSYSGRKKLSRAFRNRFISLLFTDITVVDTMAILEARRPLVSDSKQLSNYIKKVLQALLNYRQRQKVFSKDGLITMRDLLKWTGRKFINKDMFIIQGYGILAERLRTVQEKEHVLQVLSSGSKITPQSIVSYYEKVVAQNLSQNKIQDSKIYVQMNKSFERMAGLTYLGVENNQPILLVGETGCGKTTLAELLSYLLRRPFYSINCHKHTEASDLLGSLRPSSDPNSTARFEFVNGVVIEAMLNGGILLIDQINTAQDSVLQRLNQVLESNTIGVQRGQGWQSIKAKAGFCIIATMNPSGDYGKKELSPALRNRFTQIWVEPITHPLLITDAKADILIMIQTKLNQAYQPQVNSQIAELIYQFIKYYNCQITERYNLSRKRLTMRDIGWMCKFITESKEYFGNDWKNSYYWALNILAIEGLKFMMNDEHQTVLLGEMKQQLLKFISHQCKIKIHGQKKGQQLQVISILRDMDFPLMIKTDLPLQLLGLKPDSRIFFSAHTDLSDLLGQFQPVENSFVWKDQQLLTNIRSGGRTALMDLNLAQQQVIEGVNSLFDYRGSIFVVELNETVTKHKDFKPMVVLKYTSGNQRKGLPNSFLNRFVKICIDDLSLQTKIAYIRSKYPAINQKVTSLLQKILQKQKNYPIERLQLLCQVCMKAPVQLQVCLQFLQLKDLTDVDKFYLMDQQEGINNLSNAQMYEQRILSLFPLVKEFNLKSFSDIENVRRINTIYSLSSFSACLVGNCKKRDEVVQVLAYVLNRKVTKIILSTMTDMNDLLGSYEQITEGVQEQMAQQKSLENPFQSKASEAHEGRKTKFVYQQSAIVKALKDQRTLLYIQVPNEVLLQRVEKGLMEVYEQSKQIVLGIDLMRQTKTSTTKFIPIRLREGQGESNCRLSQSGAYFTQNLCNLTHVNDQLRRKQLQTYLEELIRTQSSRPKILSYKKMLFQNQNSSVNTLESQARLSQKEAKCKQRRIKQLPFKYSKQSVSQVLESIYSQVKTTLIDCQAFDFATFKQNMLMKSFLGISVEQINKKSALYGKSQQKLLQTIQKYQVLFMCDINSFQLTSLKVLSVIFSPGLTLEESTQMLGKFNNQIDRLYEQLFRDKIKEVVINFNDQETKIIPIVSNQETVKYLMRENSLSVRLISQVTPKVSLALNEGIQKRVVEIIQVLKVSESDISSWVMGMRLKDLKPYQVFEQKIKVKSSLLPNLQTLQQLCVQMIKTVLPSEIQAQLFNSTQSPSDISIPKQLIDLFRPASSLAQNVSLHIKTQIQYETIKQVIAEDQMYLKCYKQICEVKYLGLQPNKYKLISKSIQGYEQKLSILAKAMVYRGHDNVKSLLQFYEYFMNSHAKIVESSFDPQTIKTVLLQSYDSFYDTFSDILLPYYLPLITIFKQNSQVNHEESLTLRTFKNQSSQNAVFSLIQQITNNENEQVDRAKDFLKFQKKFNRTVIIDEYTQEGVQRNKKNLQQQFNQLFGRNQTQQSGPLSQIDQVFYLLNKQTQNYYNMLCNKLNQNTKSYEQLIISLALTTANMKVTNIYEQRNTDVVKQLIQPVPKMLHQVLVLLGKYKIDSLKVLAGLLGKIYDHKAYKDEVYKILVDCQFIIEKSFQLNSILPAAERVPCDQLIVQCLKLRRLQLKNWKSMLHFKQQRTQKSDVINLIEFYRMVKFISNSKEAFTVTQNFLRQSTICCLPSRMSFLDLIARSLIEDQKIQNSIYRVIGFYEYLLPHVNQFYMNSYNGKVLQMKEYQKLAGWSSNQYLIFRATCEKFQRKIHHILRKFDDQISMTLAMLIQQLKNKQIVASIQQFNTKSKKQFGFVPQQESQNQDQDKASNDQDQDKDGQEKKLPTQKPQEIQQEQAINSYEQIIRQLFQCLNQLSQGYQNSQSKLRIIRLSLEQLEQVVKDKKHQLTSLDGKAFSQGEHKYLSRQMFQTQQQYSKACKHYYGLWDRLCQRHQTAWNRQIVDRIWNVAQGIWHISNTYVPKAQVKSPQNQLVQDLKVLFKPYLLGEVNQQLVSNKYLQNPIFKQEVQTVKRYILQNLEEETQMNYKIPKDILSLVKLGYLISSIALNLQKSGLCVKEQEQNQGDQSGTEQVGDGMGIGQGQVHQGAQNVGDQIQFQQQVQGHKDEQKVQQDQGNQNKQEQNDIQMQGQFQGQMYDKQKPQEEQGQQGQQVSNQQMGQVDDQKRQEDMKNQQGQAEGKGQADLDIQGQQEGEQQLVDNERQQDKQQRKGQQKRQNQQEEEAQEQQRSDWQDNNDQGQKINKQNENVEEHERDEENMNDQQDPQQLSDEESGEGNSQKQQMDLQDQQNSNQPEQNQNQEQQDPQNEQIQIQNSEEPIQQQKKQEQTQKKQAKNRRQYERTYGRQDDNFENNNLVNNQQMEEQQNLGQGQQNAQGSGEGQKGAGKSVHSLRQQFLQQIMKKQNKSKGNQQFLKNLDVRIQEEDDQDLDSGDAEEQQYALAEEDNKMSTNLAMMDLQQKKKAQELKEEKQKERNAKEQQQGNQQKQKDKNIKNQRKKPSQQDSRNDELVKADQVQEQNQKNQDKKRRDQESVDDSRREPTKADKDKEKAINLVDQHQEQLIKAAILSLSNNEPSSLAVNFSGHTHLITQSFLLSKILQEQLKSVLQPLDQAEYRGDYKTGKKLNLKKIIPFIASNYRKDRIWLRRTQPSQRNYYIMLALDDTKSMHYGNVGQQALKGLLSISMALQHLNIKTCITAIKDNMEVSKNFNDLLNCQKILQDFSFQYESSNSHDLSMSSFMASSLSEFEKVQAAEANGQSRQLCIIISDGKMNKQMVKPFLKEAAKKGITYVFIVIDSARNSILNIKTVEYVNGKMEIKSYMNDFPFDFFLVINNAKQLGDILGATLMQFIQEK